MPYKIKIVNSQGTMYTREFSTRKAAENMVAKQKKSDADLNKKGLVKATTMRPILIKNKYSIVKV